MLREYSQFFKNLLVLLDLSLLSLCWLVSYLIIEASGFMPDEQSRGSIYTHTMWVLPIWCIWIGVFRAFNLYRPRRIPSDASELWDITKGCTLTSLGVSTLSLFLNQPFSRPSLIVFWLMSISLMSSSRSIFRSFLRAMRRKGYNRRHVLIVGASRLGQELAEKLDSHPEIGMHVVGYVTRRPQEIGRTFKGARVLGTYDEIPAILSAHSVDQVFVAVPLEEYVNLHKTMLFLQDRTVDVRIVADIHEFNSLGGQAEGFDGLPIITLQGSPHFGWNSCVKRATDLF